MEGNLNVEIRSGWCSKASSGFDMEMKKGVAGFTVIQSGNLEGFFLRQMKGLSLRSGLVGPVDVGCR